MDKTRQTAPIFEEVLFFEATYNTKINIIDLVCAVFFGIDLVCPVFSCIEFVCAVFLFPINDMATMLGVFNVHTDVDACKCTWEL